MKRLLVDSGALLALIDRGDQHHHASVTFAQANPGVTFYLPEPVFIETMLLVKSRLGALPAIDLGEQLMHSPRFHVLYLTVEERHAIWEIFSRYRDKGWSYVDCSILAAAHRLSVSRVFAFDHHFDQMAGLERLPR